uniref:N-acetyltransferase domain-containing protein n=2 Tax=Rhodosorus marinus TaxID=101924 RepID=A0A7S2ZDF1_9RHOD|mmetsp:Transcript_14583/g.59208  ORF Transcript_14583/g.59208 Transcript_14583/m.59208 type:complete len:176 (+) Transcript_14583:2119-2646(+)
MATTRRLTTDDLYKFNLVNLDPFTVTFNMHFYFQYMSQWPDFQKVMLSPNGTIMGYMIGKAEGTGENWHGHVSAVTVAPEYRRLGLARKLMDFIEELSEKTFNCYFVDLFVRVTNTVAIEMYKHFGYVVYRTVMEYYSGNEDAYDMRKALGRDVQRKSMIPLSNPVHISDLKIPL